MSQVTPPLVSVVIPCRNEKKYIRGCVEAILQSEYPRLEVIVVDGESDDGTVAEIDALAKQYSNVRRVNNPKRLTPYAFNLGVLNSEGEFVQIVGSRNVLDRHYISQLVRALQENPQMGCVGGDYQHTFDNDDSRYIAWAMESKFGVGGSNYRTMKQSCYVDTVGVPVS